MESEVLEHEVMRVRSGDICLVGDRWAPEGESAGTVVLLHGGGQRRHSWQRTAERLARAGWTAYAFDSRGHGESDWASDGNYSISAQVDDLMAIIGSLSESPVLVGASLGGMTSMVAEGEHGPISRGLVLVDTAARLESVGVDRIQEFMNGAPDGFATLEEAAEAIAAYNPHRPRPKSLTGLRKNLVQGEDGRWRWHWDPRFLQRGTDSEGEIRYERAVAAARKVTVPTLLVRGARSDMISSEGVAEMRALIPHARAVEVGAAGHMIAGDDNDVFTTELFRFVEAAVRTDH